MMGYYEYDYNGLDRAGLFIPVIDLKCTVLTWAKLHIVAAPGGGSFRP
jgi:hypothetical protein